MRVQGAHPPKKNSRPHKGASVYHHLLYWRSTIQAKKILHFYGGIGVVGLFNAHGLILQFSCPGVT